MVCLSLQAVGRKVFWGLDKPLDCCKTIRVMCRRVEQGMSMQTASCGGLRLGANDGCHCCLLCRGLLMVQSLLMPALHVEVGATRDMCREGGWLLEELGTGKLMVEVRITAPVKRGFRIFLCRWSGLALVVACAASTASN